MARLAGVFAVLLIVGLAGWLLVSNTWTSASQPAPKPAIPKPVEKYALNWDAKVEPAAFDAKRAMGYLKDICDIGPRMSGTNGMKKQQELMEKHFKDLGGKITWQKFTATQNSVGRPTEMANLIVSWKPEEKRRIILCSHYDTRPIADQEPKRELRSKPIVSANDGGSGVALMMELAHQMSKLPLNVGIDFVFFDGEEFVFNRSDSYFFGSKFFADEYRKTKKETGVVYQGAILLDMIAGKNLRLPVERNSWWLAPGLVKDIYKIADQLQAGAFKGNEFSKFEVEDDHLALNRGGIPAVDLIDFDYVHWHRLSDVPENCSGENMEQVARVVSVWMQRVK